MADACCDRRRFLSTTPAAGALSLWLSRAPAPAVETLAVTRAAGRILSAGAVALRSTPHYHSSAMDGVAIAASSSFGASEVSPRRLSPDQFEIVDTGDPIPAGADSVIMVEDVQWLEDGGIELVAAATPWQHVRLAGEDLVATEMAAPAGRRLGGPEIAALLAAGVDEVQVYARPRVTIIPTGDELIAPRAGELPPGAVPETNGAMLAAMVEEWGGAVTIAPTAPDRREEMSRAVLDAAGRSDLVLIIAGSSAGRDDLAPHVIAGLGELLVHGIAIMPGKPAALGLLGGCMVAGMPGYPVSSWVIAREFIRPLLRVLQGLPPGAPAEKLTARCCRRIPSRIGQDELLRVQVAPVGGSFVCVPLPRGASMLSSVVRAGGIVRIDASREGLEMGEEVEVELLLPRDQLERTLLCIGSHDLLLDLLSEEMAALPGASFLSSGHVGSLGGLLALDRGECHLAGCHLLDEETGEYNTTWIRRHVTRVAVVQIHLAVRSQGLIVRPGESNRFANLAELAAKGGMFINRQRGSGTRQLLDQMLRKQAIPPASIRGYDREAYTHLAVAAAVKSGAADAGLGVLAAARALDLDFIPLAGERYDLVIREDQLKTPGLAALLQVLHSHRFRERVSSLGGYNPQDMGEMIYEHRPDR